MPDGGWRMCEGERKKEVQGQTDLEVDPSFLSIPFVTLGT